MAPDPLPAAAVGRLKAMLRGELIRPGDPGYETARRVHNGMIDKRPALIARCAGVADVAAAVRFAGEHGLLLAVRGGGHSGAGWGTCDGGLVLDLSPLRGIEIDPVARTARVAGGCTWGEVDRATHPFGLATPSGIHSTTGVGGLTLGGGLGHLTRRHGLTIDNLLAVELVLADGRVVSADHEQHPDLFWAVRGGGGNFGVVTAFRFRLHPVAAVVAGPTFWPLARAETVLRWYREILPAAPEDLNGRFGFLTVPPLPAFPERLHGRPVCSVTWCYTGPSAGAAAAFRPLREIEPPLFAGIEPVPFPVLQSATDPVYPPGLQWYWRADFVDELSDAAIAVHLEHASRLPTAKSTVQLHPIDGAAHRVDPAETAFWYRRSRWAQVIAGVDPDPVNAERIKTWTSAYWEALHPHSAGGAYVNFMMDEGPERVRATYRDNEPRLAAIKARYDPGNLFRVNQNIKPR